MAGNEIIDLLRERRRQEALRNGILVWEVPDKDTIDDYRHTVEAFSVSVTPPVKPGGQNAKMAFVSQSDGR
jgi:hypothetical protein